MTTPRLRALLALASLASIGLPSEAPPPRRQPPRDPPEPATQEDFHAHLEACERCRTRPFDLCSVGADIAERVGLPAVAPADVDDLRQAMLRPDTVKPVPPGAVPQDLDVGAFDAAARLLRAGLEAAGLPPDTELRLARPGDERPAQIVAVPVLSIPLAEPGVEPLAYRVHRPSIADRLPDLPTVAQMSEAERACRDLHVMRLAPGRSTLNEAAQADRKRKNKAAKAARKRNRR